MKTTGFAAASLMALAAAIVLALPNSQATAPLIVHEWGTFTSYQDASGRALGGINTDDEPVPLFVHRLGNGDLVSPIPYATSTIVGGKGIPERHPSVTMRLETPVIYFHLPAGSPPMSVKVNVEFHGGWLTEFYPNADVKAPGVIPATNPAAAPIYGPITPATIGSLSWPNVQIGLGGEGPAAHFAVWNTPRNVQADSIKASEESEKFLFYRGVGNVDSPLRVERTESPGRLRIVPQDHLDASTAAELRGTPMWLVRIAPDLSVDWDRVGMDGAIDSGFATPGTHGSGLVSLHRDMSAALVQAGLFSDEAEAMLNTWEVSYFKSPGLRLFFLVSRSWTDARLPLSISENASANPLQITRVMVGRIEILTPEQESLVQTIEAGPYYEYDDLPSNLVDVEGHLYLGEPIGNMLKDYPPDLRAYILLGRFRDALLLNQQEQHPNPILAEFIKKHIAIFPLQ